LRGYHRFAGDGGAGGIRTHGTAFQPYNDLANRRLQPLGHSSIPVLQPATAEGIIAPADAGGLLSLFRFSLQALSFGRLDDYLQYHNHMKINIISAYNEMTGGFSRS
jgi:hypothetical protein